MFSLLPSPPRVYSWHERPIDHRHFANILIIIYASLYFVPLPFVDILSTKNQIKSPAIRVNMRNQPWLNKLNFTENFRVRVLPVCTYKYSSYWIKQITPYSETSSPSHHRLVVQKRRIHWRKMSSGPSSLVLLQKPWGLGQPRLRVRSDPEKHKQWPHDTSKRASPSAAPGAVLGST